MCVCGIVSPVNLQCTFYVSSRLSSGVVLYDLFCFPLAILALYKRLPHTVAVSQLLSVRYGMYCDGSDAVMLSLLLLLCLLVVAWHSSLPRSLSHLAAAAIFLFASPFSSLVPRFALSPLAIVR